MTRKTSTSRSCLEHRRKELREVSTWIMTVPRRITESDEARFDEETTWVCNGLRVEFVEVHGRVDYMLVDKVEDLVEGRAEAVKLLDGVQNNAASGAREKTESGASVKTRGGGAAGDATGVNRRARNIYTTGG